MWTTEVHRLPTYPQRLRRRCYLLLFPERKTHLTLNHFCVLTMGSTILDIGLVGESWEIRSGMTGVTSGIKSPFTVFGLAMVLGSDSYLYATGTYDRFHYAAALTVDTLAVIGTAAIAGAASGFVAGAFFGGVGSIPGALMGATAGIVVGTIAAVGFSQNYRKPAINALANQYSRWFGP